MRAIEACRWIRERLERRAVRGVVFTVLAVAVIVFAGQVQRRASRPIGNDLTSYLLSASALWTGEDPYSTPTVFPYVYPLFLAFLLRPLSLLPPLLAQGVWFVAGVAALGLAGRLFVAIAARAMSWEAARYPAGAVGVLALFLLDPIQINLVNAQVNFLVLALLALFLKEHLAGRRIPAGVSLGAAVALKLVPAALFVFLLARRAFRTLALAVASTVVFCLLPYACAGERLWSYYAGYVRGFVLARVQGPAAPGQEIVFSLGGAAKALLPGAPSLLLHALGAALLLGPASALAYRRRDPASAVWAFGLFLTAIPLLTPMSEVHHLALLFPAATWTTLAALYRPTPVDGVAATLTAVGWICFWIGRLDRLGPYYWIALIAFYAAMLPLALRRRRDASPPAAGCGSPS